MIFEWDQLIKAAAQPFVPIALPINRLSCICSLSPLPAGSGPKFWLLVTAFSYKRSELCIRDCGPGNRERVQLNLVRIHLVVKNKRLIRQAAEQKMPAGDQGIA